MMTYEDVARADRNYEYFFGDLWTLMQNAGRRVADFVSSAFGTGRRILVVAGSGNNGGDGIVAGSLLSQNNSVAVFPVAGVQGMKTRDARQAIRMYRGMFLDITAFKRELSNFDVIIDAIFGSGFSGEPRPPYDDIIESINSSSHHIVSVDVPSALGSRLAVKPEATVTFTDVKEGMNEENSGQIIVADIGIPEKVFNYNGPGEFVYYRRAAKGSHKGMNGRVAVVGGWTFHGSAVIASQGALGIGSDLVKVYVKGKNYQVISSYNAGIIVRDMDTISDETELMNNDSILLGSGLGSTQNLGEVLERMRGFSGTIVLDAEGLDFLDSVRSVAPRSNVILTPHSGEFKRISGREATPENAVSFASRNNAIIILKGAIDTVTDGTRTRYTEGGNSRMTMGGTGDLLAGLTAGLAARSTDPFRAACMASFLNKSAGDFCHRQKSYWYDVNDMIRAIPEIMRLYVG